MAELRETGRFGANDRRTGQRGRVRQSGNDIEARGCLKIAASSVGGLILGILFSFITWVNFNETVSEARLLLGGTSIGARVVSKTSSVGSKSITRYMTYEIPGAGRFQKTVDEDFFWSSPNKGATIEVVCLPTDPEVNDTDASLGDFFGKAGVTIFTLILALVSLKTVVESIAGLFFALAAALFVVSMGFYFSRNVLDNPGSAADRGDMKMLRWYARQEYDLNRKYEPAAFALFSFRGSRYPAFMKTPMEFAARQGRIEAIDFLIEKGCTLPPDKSAELLLNAISYQDTEVLKTLLRVPECDPDAADEKGETPLMRAVSRGHFEAVRILLAHGADPFRENHSGTSAAALAERSSKREISALFKDLSTGTPSESADKVPIRE